MLRCSAEEDAKVAKEEAAEAKEQATDKKTKDEAEQTEKRAEELEAKAKDTEKTVEAKTKGKFKQMLSKMVRLLFACDPGRADMFCPHRSSP